MEGGYIKYWVKFSGFSGEHSCDDAVVSWTQRVNSSCTMISKGICHFSSSGNCWHIPKFAKSGTPSSQWVHSANISAIFAFDREWGKSLLFDRIKRLASSRGKFLRRVDDREAPFPVTQRPFFDTQVMGLVSRNSSAVSESRKFGIKQFDEGQTSNVNR